jgi:hypothetical protein
MRRLDYVALVVVAVLVSGLAAQIGVLKFAIDESKEGCNNACKVQGESATLVSWVADYSK